VKATGENGIGVANVKVPTAAITIANKDHHLMSHHE